MTAEDTKREPAETPTRAPDPSPSSDSREDFGTYLLSAMKNVALYPAGHPVCTAILADLHRAATALLGDRERFVLSALGRELILDGQPLGDKSAILSRLAEEFHRAGLEKIIVSQGIVAQELWQFVGLLSGELAQGHVAFNRLLDSRGVSHIRAGSLEEPAKSPPSPPARGLKATEEDYLRAQDSLSEIQAAALEGREIKSREVSSLAKMLVRGALEKKSPFMAILNIHSKDDYTATHSIDVALLTILQTGWLNLGDSLTGDVATAALLHDLGKQKIPNEIINKPGKLTPEEWTAMRSHSVEGARLCREIQGVSPLASLVAFEHHLRYDLSGYPTLRRPASLSIVSMAVAVADTYDAMRSRRPYQRELPPEEAAAVLLNGAGTGFHPDLVRRFLERVGVYGLHSLVQLFGGELALVAGYPPDDPHHPLVRIVADADGLPVTPRLVDTGQAAREGRMEEVVEMSLPADRAYEEIIRNQPW